MSAMFGALQVGRRVEFFYNKTTKSGNPFRSGVVNRVFRAKNGRECVNVIDDDSGLPQTFHVRKMRSVFQADGFNPNLYELLS